MPYSRIVPVDLQVVNPMTKYALTIAPVAMSLEELMPSGRLRSYSVSLIIRTTLVVSTLIVAQTFPYFGKKFHIFQYALIFSFCLEPYLLLSMRIQVL